MERDSFIFYKSFWDSIDAVSSKLSSKNKVVLYENIIKTSLKLDENIEETKRKLSENPIVFSLFLSFLPQILANNRRYENGCKGREYGVLGGAPIGNFNAKKQPQNNPKTTPNNNENENENVNEEIDKSISKKTKQKKVFDFSFVDENLKIPFENFLNYRKEIGKPYKSQQSIQEAFFDLKTLSGGNPEVASEIVRQTISNQWQGIFPLKNQTKQSNNKQDVNDLWNKH
jgi:hypothetical protein